MSDNEFYRLWNEFGRNMNLVAILTILTLVTGVTGLVAIIFVFISLGNIKLINSKLKSLYLYDFRSKMVSSFIYKLISICLLAGGIVGIVFSTYFWSNTDNIAALIVNIILSSSPALIGLILLIVGFSIEMKAWDNLKFYIEENRSLFPEYVVRETIEGAEKLRTAALMYALGFLGITLIIGFILQIIGFFKLAKFSNMSGAAYIEVPVIPQAPMPPRAPSPPQAPAPPQVMSSVHPDPINDSSKINRVVGIRPKFCPNCGAEILEGGGYCPDCGSSIS